jgi:hypothetical protein
MKLKSKAEFILSQKLGFSQKKIKLFWQWITLLKENALAVLPISLLLVLALLIFFGEPIRGAGLIVIGSLAAIIGLSIFAEGLRLSIMPLAEMIGAELPSKQPLKIVLLTCGVLGILVTYAEPAIAAFNPLAKILDRREAPYLFFALTKYKEIVVFAIGIGVGLAAVIGTLRFLYGWSIKPIILISLIANLILTAYMNWGYTELSSLIGLAWDCGAVTTGPVTVPILIAIGIGVMKNRKEQIRSAQVLQYAIEHGTSTELEGFGIVTLASLFPVFFVQFVTVIISRSYTIEEIIAYDHDFDSDNILNQSPVSEILFAVRSIFPLVAALLLIIRFLIKKPIPLIKMAPKDATELNIKREVNPDVIHAIEDSSIEAVQVTQYSSGNESKGVTSLQNEISLNSSAGSINDIIIGQPSKNEAASNSNGVFKNSVEIGNAGEPNKSPLDSKEFDYDVSGLDLTATDINAAELYQSYSPVSKREDKTISKSAMTWIRYHKVFLIGLVYTFVGMILFNLGMTYGFSSLANHFCNSL